MVERKETTKKQRSKRGAELGKRTVVESGRVGEWRKQHFVSTRTFLFIPGCNPLDELKSTLRLSSPLATSFFLHLDRFRSA